MRNNLYWLWLSNKIQYRWTYWTRELVLRGTVLCIKLGDFFYSVYEYWQEYKKLYNAQYNSHPHRYSHLGGRANWHTFMPWEDSGANNQPDYRMSDRDIHSPKTSLQETLLTLEQPVPVQDSDLGTETEYSDPTI
jgi:hypothetical protein